MGSANSSGSQVVQAPAMRKSNTRAKGINNILNASMEERKKFIDTNDARIGSNQVNRRRTSDAKQKATFEQQARSSGTAMYRQKS